MTSEGLFNSFIPPQNFYTPPHKKKTNFWLRPCNVRSWRFYRGPFLVENLVAHDVDLTGRVTCDTATLFTTHLQQPVKTGCFCSCCMSTRPTTHLRYVEFSCKDQSSNRSPSVLLLMDSWNRFTAVKSTIHHHHLWSHYNVPRPPYLAVPLDSTGDGTPLLQAPLTWNPECAPHGRRSSVHFWGQDIYARTLCMKKITKCPYFTWYLPGKYQNARIFMTFAWKMPEFHTTVVRKISSHFFFFGGGGLTCLPYPQFPTLWRPLTITLVYLQYATWFLMWADLSRAIQH